MQRGMWLLLLTAAAVAQQLVDVDGPLGSETLRAKLDKESELDKEAGSSSSHLMQQRIRDARNAEQEAEARFKELDAQEVAKSRMMREGLGSKRALENMIAEAQLRVQKERQAALSTLLSAKREARQAKLDAVRAAIKGCTKAEKGVVEQWYNTRRLLREQQDEALRTAEQLLRKSTQAARTKRDDALERAAQIKSDLKVKAAQHNEAGKTKIRMSKQLAIGQSFEAKALALKQESPANYTNSVHDEYLKVIQEPDQANLEDHNTELEMMTSKAQQEAAHKAEQDAKQQLKQLENEYASSVERAEQAGKQAVERANSDLQADLDLAKAAAREESKRARGEFEQGMRSAAEAKSKDLANAEEQKKSTIKEAKSKFDTKIASLTRNFDSDTGKIDQAYLNKVHQAQQLRRQEHVPLYKEYNSQKERAAREKASSLERISNQAAIPINTPEEAAADEDTEDVVNSLDDATDAATEDKTMSDMPEEAAADEAAAEANGDPEEAAAEEPAAEANEDPEEAAAEEAAAEANGDPEEAAAEEQEEKQLDPS